MALENGEPGEATELLRHALRLWRGPAMSDVETNAWTDSDFLAQARERAVKFTIADGEKKTIDLPVTTAPVF